MNIENVPDSLAKQSKEGWLVIFGGFALHFLFGPLFLWGELMVYFYSYLRQFDQKSSVETLSWGLPIGFAVFQLTTLGLEKIMRRFSVTKITCCGFFIMIAGLFISSELQSTIPFLLTLSLSMGFSLGLLSLMSTTCGLRHFPERKGRVIGLTQIGASFGCFLVGIFVAFFINPNNLKANTMTPNIYFNECVSNQIPRFLKLLAFCYAILGMISLFYIQNPKNGQSDFEVPRMDRIIEYISKKKGICLILLCSLPSMEGFFWLLFYKQVGLYDSYEDNFLSRFGVFCVSLIWLTKVPWNMIGKTSYAILLITVLQITAKLLLFYRYVLAMMILEFLAMSGILAITTKLLVENLDLKAAKKMNVWMMIALSLAAFSVCLFRQVMINWFFLFFNLKDIICIILQYKLLLRRNGISGRITRESPQIFEDEPSQIGI